MSGMQRAREMGRAPAPSRRLEHRRRAGSWTDLKRAEPGREQDARRPTGEVRETDRWDNTVGMNERNTHNKAGCRGNVSTRRITRPLYNKPLSSTGDWEQCG